MAPNTSTWIDTRYAQNLLQQAENDKTIKVRNVTVKPATVKGDNYLSEMQRVGVEFTRVRDGREIQEKKSFVVKVLPMGDVREELVKSVGIYDVEMSMVLETLPKMNQLLTDYKLGSGSLSPRCLLVKREDPIHLTFEDLATRGFRMADRQLGMDLDHCLLALQNLARFHASSVALKETDPEAFVQYSKGIFRQDSPVAMREYFEKAVKTLANETRDWDGLSPRIPEKLLKLSEVTWQKGCELTKLREDEFNVLLHGDFWVNNMMFAYDDQKKPIDHIFVDFQLSFWGSPAIDLLYFLAGSPTDTVRKNHRDLLLREYHNSLTSAMAKLECKTKTPSFDVLRKMIKDRASYEAIISFVILPILLLDKSQAKGLDELLDTDAENHVLGYRTKEFKEVMSRLLPLYDSLGLLDD